MKINLTDKEIIDRYRQVSTSTLFEWYTREEPNDVNYLYNETTVIPAIDYNTRDCFLDCIHITYKKEKEICALILFERRVLEVNK